MFVWSKDSKIASYPNSMLLGWCTRIGWALAQRSNRPGCSVAHVSCFARSPTLCRKCHSRVCACGVKNVGYHSPSFCLCKRIARMSCLAYERGSSTLSFTRNVERSTPPPPFARFEQRMAVPNFWRRQLFGRLPVRSDVQQRHKQSGWGLLRVEMRSSMDLILKNLGAV